MSKVSSGGDGIPVELFQILKDDAEKTLKFSKPGFNNTWTMNLLMFMPDLEKAEEAEIKLPTSIGSSKKWESSRKSSYSALLTMPKPLCGSQQTGKFFKRWEYKTIWPEIQDHLSWDICIEVKKQQLELDMEQQTDSKLEKEYQEPQICRWHHPYVRKWRTTEPLDESERGEWKSWLKTQHLET